MSDRFLAALEAMGDPERAAQARTYHKADRRYLGIRVPEITALTKDWRSELDLDARLALADRLWESDIHEARIAAAKLLTQARIRPDQRAWRLICSWVPDFDAWAIADHACDAGQRRLIADPSRLDEVEAWTRSEHMWTRRAALVITLPWTKQNHPSNADLAIRDRVLGWAAGYVPDHEWFIQKAIAWWLRELSKHDPDRVRNFLIENGTAMKPFARKEAARHLPDQGLRPRLRVPRSLPRDIFSKKKVTAALFLLLQVSPGAAGIRRMSQAGAEPPARVGAGDGHRQMRPKGWPLSAARRAFTYGP